MNRILNSLFGKQKKINYERFVVITRSRTGSNLLISLLNSHPQISAKGEVFSRLEGRKTKAVYDEVFPVKSDFSFLGFKIFYYHPLDAKDQSIWKILDEDKEIKIIHLQRKNLLRVHISRLIAGKTDAWTSREEAGLSAEDKKVHINVDDLFSDIEESLDYIKDTNNRFRHHEVLEVFYEDLTANRDHVMEEVFSFLDLPMADLTSDLKKQNPEELSALVSNFEEVMNRLKASEHAYMLDS